MSKEIRLNAFNMNCVGHLSHGQWAHPRDTSVDYTKLSYWTQLAQLLEAGKFDGIFLADVIGAYDVYQGGASATLRQAVQVPVNDPLLVVPAMAQVTKHLGFGVTSNLSFEPPYLFARRMSTLDHLTGGRIGWNIVTGYVDSGAKGMGRSQQTSHDTRYDIADEYLEVVYKLWEGSWDDRAVVRDRQARVFADPAHVRKVRHFGPHFQVDGIHLSEPSPQRTPVLFQAGSSPRGRNFAARHAEATFVVGHTKHAVATLVSDLRRRAVEHGRRHDDLTVFAGVAVIVGKTERDARAKHEEYLSYASDEGGLAHFSATTGIDFSRYDLDEPISYVETDAMISALDILLRSDPARRWTVRDLAKHVALGGRGPLIVGTPEQVADELQSWVAEADVDGFNLSRIVTPESFVDFVELVVPELQRRGVFKTEYREGTLRQKLGGAARLPDRHPAAAYRSLAGDALAAE